MYSLILIGVIALIILLCAGLAALFGFSKTKTNLVITIASAAVALGVCWLTKAVLPTADVMMAFVEGKMEWITSQFGASVAQIAAQALEFAAISPTLAELSIQLVTALALPALCLVLFITLFLISWVIATIISGIVSIVRKKRAAQADDDDDEEDRPRKTALSRLFAAGFGVVQGVVIVVVLLIPISGYLNIAQPTLKELTTQGVLPADQPVILQVQDAVEELDASPALNVYRKLGGRALSDSIMSMKVAGMNVKVTEELSSVITLAQHVLELKDTKFEDYGEEQAQIINSIGDSFADSKLLTPIVGDIIYAATDAWLKGETFIGIAMPSLGDNAEMLEPMVVALLEILHDDAKDALLLQADVKTTAELVSIMARNGVFANLSNTDALLSSLSGNAISDMVTSLGANQSMKRMIPEIMNLGVRAVGQVLSIPVDTAAVYDTFMNTVADELNELRALPEQERIPALSAELSTAFDTAGMEVDEQVLDFYATAMLHDLVDGNTNDVTAADVQAFFVLYAQSTVQTTSELRGKPTFDTLSGSSDDPLAGTVYERMTEQQRQNSGAVAVASLCVKLSALNENDTSITERATAMITETFTDLLGDNQAALEIVVSVQITAPVSPKTNECAASLQSVEETKKTSKVVTLENLLVDAKQAAENINPETIGLDAKAISAIFETASSLLNVLDGGELNLADLASSVGTILDSLAETNTFGKDKTASLFTSVLQSETVREKANLDMKTATQLAEKATEGENVSYSETMNTVAGAANIMDSLSKDGTISEEELIDVIRNLNAQTAGMIEVYVTPARLVENKIPEKYSEISSDLIKSLFGYIADSDKTNSEAEAKALNQILNIALAAKESDDKKLFSSAPGADDGRLPTATETVNTLLDSKAVRHALVDVLTDGNNVTVFDPYELSGKIKEGSSDYAEAVNAIYDYRAQHPEINDLVFEALAALLGVQVDLSK